MPRFRELLVVCGMSASCMLGGCAFLKDPDVQVQSVLLTQQSEDALAVQFDVVLSNPNSEPLELQNVLYEVTLAGHDVFAAKRAALMTLPANGTATLRIPAVIDRSEMPDVAPAELECSIDGSLRFRAPGALEQTLFKEGVRKPSVAIQGKKRIEFAE